MVPGTLPRWGAGFPARRKVPKRFCSLPFRVGVGLCAEKMQRNIGLVSHHPAVVPWRDVEDIPGLHFDHPSVVHGRRRTAGEHHADVFDGATPPVAGPT